MYSVSNDFKTAIKAPAQEFDLRGYIDEEAFYKDDVLKGSFSITNQCSGNDEVAIGSVYIGELNVTFLLDLPDYSLVGKTITVEVGVRISENAFEYVPMGVYIVAEATKTAAGLVIKAYDNMSLLDKAFTDQAQGTPYQIAYYACTECGLTLANANFDNFANHDKNLIEHPSADIETFRDLLYWLSQSLGCFVTADRNGNIAFRAYNMTVVDTLDTSHRFTGGKFSDYTTYYTGLSCVNIEEQTTSYYALPDDDG